MSLQAVQEVLDRLFTEAGNVVHHADASVLVQFGAGEFQKLKAAYASIEPVVANDLEEAYAVAQAKIQGLDELLTNTKAQAEQQIADLKAQLAVATAQPPAPAAPAQE